jgi:hypothetical protein
MNLFGWIIVLFVLAIINFFIANNDLKAFLARHASIDSYQSMDAFKKMVRKQMMQALLQLVLLLATGVLPIYGLFTHKITFGQFLLCILFDFVILGLGKKGKEVEEKSRSLTVNDPSLEEQYKRICETWVKKPFPDF